MTAKKIISDLIGAGWVIIDESHSYEVNEPGRIVPHYYKVVDPRGGGEVEISAGCDRHGDPGEVMKMWIDGRRTA